MDFLWCISYQKSAKTSCQATILVIEIKTANTVDPMDTDFHINVVTYPCMAATCSYSH